MDNDIIVGLGGHIDHGKTSLIKALNGFDGDMQPQEKQRGITLDISFSNLYIPSCNRNIAFIDVPGHDKLIKNMIAGAYGIDILLLTVASDDGLMPQSIEHLKIADILGIQLAICVITKVDLPTSEKNITKLKKDIQTIFSKNTNTKLYAIAEFSIHDKNTHHQLLNLLGNITKPTKKPDGFFRCYIDRSFSLQGYGSIVTGSIISGNINKDDLVYICELDTQVPIKSIKNHHHFIDKATIGHRIAFNLKGIESNKLKRGFLLAQKGYIRGFDEIDVVIYLFEKSLNLHNLEVQFFIGSKKCNAKISLLQPNQESIDKPYFLATLKTEEKIFSVFKEKFILRHSDKTIGGGEILNPITDPMKKRQKNLYLDFLLQQDFKNVFLLCSSIHKKGFGLISSSQRFNLTHQQALQIAKTLPEVFVDSKNLIVYHFCAFENIKNDILKTFDKNQNALLSATSIGQKNKWASIDFISKALEELEKENLICKKEGLYLSKKNNIKNIEQYLQEILYKTILSQKFAPLSPYNIYDSLDIDRKKGDSILKTLCASKKVIRLEHNLFIAQEALSELHALMRSFIKKHGYIDVALFKDNLALSRKYLIAYLDSLDKYDDITNTQGRRTFKYQGKKCD